MLQEGKGPINFTVFLTLFGEKLNGEPGAGLAPLAGQRARSPPGPVLTSTQTPSRPHLALAAPEGVGPTPAFQTPGHWSPQVSRFGNMPSASTPKSPAPVSQPGQPISKGEPSPASLSSGHVPPLWEVQRPLLLGFSWVGAGHWRCGCSLAPSASQGQTPKKPS